MQTNRRTQPKCTQSTLAVSIILNSNNIRFFYKYFFDAYFRLGLVKVRRAPQGKYRVKRKVKKVKGRGDEVVEH